VEFPIDRYCERTGVSASGNIDADRLEELQRAQIYSIPFENFDVQLGHGVDLTPTRLINKLIDSRRGGYCFELNGLFLAAIRFLGFDARPLLGRVHISGEPTGRGHQLSLVNLNGRQFVADVGFGGPGPRTPMPLEFGSETLHDGRIMRLVEHDLGYMLQHKPEDEWVNLYSFDLTPVVGQDIAYGNYFTSTHPTSIFKLARIAVRSYPDGNAALFNFRCTTTRGSNSEVEELPDDERYLTALSTLFGIELEPPYEQLAPLAPSESW
jgi:N-hydroxyarylamine O-acetyltransferase